MTKSEKRTGRSRSLRVLAAVSQRSSTENPYIALLYRNVQPAAVVNFFSWRRAIFGRYDVLHVHWPEALVSGRKGWRRASKYCLAMLMFWRLRITGRALVRTVHNETPHEAADRLTRKTLNSCNRATTKWIVLNDQTRLPTDAQPILIPHGHYRDWFAEIPPLDVDAQRTALFFGLIRPYKGVENVLNAFSEDPSLQDALLQIAGRPDDARLAGEVSALAKSRSNIAADLRYVPDADLMEYLTRTSLVILPYRAVGNSGAALLALSMNRPILMPRHTITEQLRVEFGADHVHLFDGELDGATINGALSAVQRSVPHDRVPMLGRDWQSIASMHIRAFESASRLAATGARRLIHRVHAVERDV